MNITPQLVIDGLLIVVIITAAIRGYKDGFFTSVINLLGNVGSLLGGLWVRNNYSDYIFDKFLRRPLTERSYNYLLQTAQNIDIGTAMENVIGKFPKDFAHILLSKAETTLSRMLTPDMDSAVLLVDTIIAPVITAVVSVLLFILTFIAIRMVCRLFAWLFKAINSVPLLGTANQFAGFFAGLLTGGINIILLSFILSIIVIVTGDNISFLNSQILSRSKILAFTGMVNPFLI